MKIINGLNNFNEEVPFPVITMGNFDGVHLGHREIFRNVVDCARSQAGTSILITFQPHPMHLLHPERELPMITDLQGRLALFRESGLDIVVVTEFTREFAELPPEQFILDILVKKMKIKVIFVGEDFGFGKGRRGNLSMLEHFGRENGFQVRVIHSIQVNDRVVSSTLIRKLITGGEVSEIPEYLGRLYSVRSTVVKGMGRGTQLGVPTANLDVRDRFLPSNGVYIAEAVYDGREWPGIAYAGIRPTFNEKTPVLEIHLFHDPGNLYGKEMEIRFIKRVRGDIRFESADALKTRIAEDIRIAQEYFHSVSRNVK